MRFYSKIFWSLLFLIKKLSIISFIEIIPEKGAQYIKSSGTRGKLFNIDKTKLRCLIILPSKIKKIFSCFSAALLGSNALYENKNYFNGKSGY
jgi:ribosomal protein L2